MVLATGAHIVFKLRLAPFRHLIKDLQLVICNKRIRAFFLDGLSGRLRFLDLFLTLQLLYELLLLSELAFEVCDFSTFPNLALFNRVDQV